eukprot:TRINITY_DN7441_c0_g4_i1.p1 TRINITY_DN7441_c0_g4~~TRINITY_DN7441_c0_g4_i1.p1  ORF type:complete len:675 (+),score=48.83 TRINITY_DN7441_c0_g4_i1:215-2026(+)
MEFTSQRSSRVSTRLSAPGSRKSSVHPMPSPSSRKNSILPPEVATKSSKSAKFELRSSWTARASTGLDSIAGYGGIPGNDHDLQMGIVPVSRVLTRIQRPSAMFKKTMSFNYASDYSCLVGSQSAWRRYIELVGFLILVYEGCWIPIEFAFQPHPVLVTILCEYASSCFWTLDILFTFNCAYVNALGREVTDRRLIAWRYLKTWFLLDLVTVLPDWIYMIIRASSGQSTSVALNNATGILRALRILRLQKLSRILHVFEQRLNSAYLLLAFQISKPVFCLVYIIHVLSCVWCLVGKMGPGSWINHYNLAGNDDLSLYANAMFWSLTQFHGTSGINPQTTFELFFASGVGLLTLMGFSTFLSTVTNLMIELSRAQERQTRVARLLNDYLDRNSINMDLSVRAKMCLKSKSMEMVESDSLESVGLPEDMVGDIKEQAICPTLLLHTLFHAISDMHERTMRHLCCEACVQRFYVGGASMFIMDDPCDSMMFHASGRAVYAHNGERDEIYSKEWFAEASLWVVWVYRGDLKALSHTRTIEISSTAFTATLELFSPFCPPAFFASYASTFLNALSECENPSDRLHFAVDIGMETDRLVTLYSYASNGR